VPFEPQPPRAPKPPRVRSTLDKEGWFRKGVNEDREPKWLVIAKRSDQSLLLVLAVKDELQAHAAKVRNHGHTDGFSSAACAEWMRVEESAVLSVVRVLTEEGWLTADRQIADWTLRQPDKEDPTAAQRQRNKRRRDAAAERAKLGLATEADNELLTAREREEYAKIASRSRVTAQPIEEPKPERVAPFRPIVAKEDTFAARDRRAREPSGGALLVDRRRHHRARLRPGLEDRCRKLALHAHDGRRHDPAMAGAAC
jgi:hypothetical protein